MKVLRIYDHLGELKKEFPVYVEGEDFKWHASVPEVLWLGTITLEKPDKEPVAEPTPIPEVVSEAQLELESEIGMELAPEPEPEQPEPETAEEADIELYGDKWNKPEPEPEVIKEEVKDEPKKVHRKRSRVKRTSPSDYLKSVKVVRQDDSGGDTDKGDKSSGVA